MSPVDVDDHLHNENAIKEIREMVATTDSNLVRHAARELQLLGEEPTVVLGYLKMIQIFAEMGHSGGSASVFTPTLHRLMDFKNLTPLTDDPDEWVHHTEEVWGEPGGVWQNVRNGEAFSSDGGKTYTLLSDERVKGDSKLVHTSHDHTKPFEREIGVSNQTEELEVAPVPVDAPNTDPEAGKYGHVFTERGHFEENEPLFIFRGTDKFTTIILQHYVDLCKAAEVSMDHIISVVVQKLVIAEWQRDHGSKLPD